MEKIGDFGFAFGFGWILELWKTIEIMDFHGSKLMDFLGQIDGFHGILMKNHRKRGGIRTKFRTL